MEHHEPTLSTKFPRIHSYVKPPISFQQCYNTNQHFSRAPNQTKAPRPTYTVSCTSKLISPHGKASSANKAPSCKREPELWPPQKSQAPRLVSRRASFHFLIRFRTPCSKQQQQQQRSCLRAVSHRARARKDGQENTCAAI